MITKIIYYDITQVEGTAVSKKEEIFVFQIVGEVIDENDKFITIMPNKCISAKDNEMVNTNLKFIIPKGCIKERYDFQEVKND